MTDPTELFLFSLKMIVVSIPFVILGKLIAPFIPVFGLGVTGFLMAFATVFGFVIMVMNAEDGDIRPQTKWLALVEKTAFFSIFIFAIACLYKIDPLSARFIRIFSAPLFIINAKIILKMNIADYF